MNAELDPDLLRAMLTLGQHRGGWDAKRLDQVSGTVFLDRDNEFLWQCNRCGGFFVANDPSNLAFEVGLVAADEIDRFESELTAANERAQREVAESPCTCEQRDFLTDPQIDDETRAKAMFVATAMERNATHEQDEDPDQIYLSTCWYLSKPENRSELDRKVAEMLEDGMGMLRFDLVPRSSTIPPPRGSWRRSWRRPVARMLRATARLIGPKQHS
jgi:hypothetical protein